MTPAIAPPTAGGPVTARPKLAPARAASSTRRATAAKPNRCVASPRSRASASTCAPRFCTQPGAELVGADIHGEIENLTINGVDIGPLVNAELDRRYPDRAKMRPVDPAGFREAWDVLGRLWGGTVERARRLPPELLHESVDGEWSFIETLRHLVFATDAWVGRVILGDPSPWDPLGLPWDEMPDTPGVPRDREARPSLDTVLELRRDRMSTVRQVIEGLTSASLDGHTEPVEGPGWPPPRSSPVRECLLVVLNEEWEHRLYAERDLDAL
jgi:DinB superfamily